MAEILLWLIGILFIIILFLLVKIHLLRKSAKEIKDAFLEKLTVDTNTTITISSRDRIMLSLADIINVQLRKLRKDRHRFQQGDLELKEAITNISHDLRTPLTAICGYLDLLEQKEMDEDIRRYFEIIKDRTEILRQSTEELFHYSITVSTVQEISFEEVILGHVLEESISAYYAAFKKSHITPKISIPEKKIKRRLNKNALFRIFENIISNAIKYSDGDLNIILSENGEIIFSNHASSLNELETSRLFDRFYTVETAKKSTGLGLSIAKILTEQMNGTITANYSYGIISICVYF